MAKMKRSFSDLEEQQYSSHVQHGYKHMHGSSSPRMKACLQCGTTRTPQWREGPLGPKTLCNACGVKRVRQMKALQEGRRPNTSTVRKHQVVYAPFQPPARTESTEVATALQMLAHQPPHQAPAELRRPVRQSAMRAIQRASEGLLEEGFGGGAHKGSMGAESNMPTDSGEEISWSPRGSPTPAKQELADLEADAVANLLSMSCAAPAAPVASAAASTPAVVDLRASPSSAAGGSPAAKRARVHLSQGVPRPAAAAARAMPEESMAYLLGPGLNLLVAMLPPQDLERLLMLRDCVEDTHREATAADAAVAAVSKILEIKEAASCRAHNMALAAARQLHQFMNQLNGEYQLGQRLEQAARTPVPSFMPEAEPGFANNNNNIGNSQGRSVSPPGSGARPASSEQQEQPQQEEGQVQAEEEQASQGSPQASAHPASMPGAEPSAPPPAAAVPAPLRVLAL